MLNCVASFGELRRMTQFKDKQRQAGRRRRRVGERRVLRLPGADGLRHLVVRHRRGARRRRPAPARRARPRRRDPLQQPLRRHVRRAEGDVPGGRRARHGPAASREQDVEVGGLTAGHDPRARSAQDDREEDQVGGHRFRRRGAPRPRRQARRLESDRDLRRGHRRDDRRGRARVRRQAVRRRSRSRSPKPSSNSCDRCRSATPSSPPIPAEIDRRLAVGRRRRRSVRRTGARPRVPRRGPVCARTARYTSCVFQGAGWSRSAGQPYLPASSPRSLPASRSRLAVPPPDAPWITTACALHHSTLTPTPMPTAGEVGLAHAAGTRPSPCTAR